MTNLTRLIVAFSKALRRFAPPFVRNCKDYSRRGAKGRKRRNKDYGTAVVEEKYNRNYGICGKIMPVHRGPGVPAQAATAEREGARRRIALILFNKPFGVLCQFTDRDGAYRPG
ncbi:MAG: hypothetical protein MZV70_65815 [Desulfobacterales bacterium]|nr:hypothetical protein [Desulfobacterales bacterium]